MLKRKLKMSNVKKRFLSRWRAIRKIRANLVLTVVGFLLLLLSLAWWLAIAPALKVVATDFDQLYTYDGTLTTYINPPGEPAPSSGQPSPIAIYVERRVFSRPEWSTPAVSVIEEDRRVLRRSDFQELYKYKRVFALERKNGKMIPFGKADRKRRGYNVVFPFDTPKGEVPVWSEQTGKTHGARFVREKKVEGLSVYEFAVEYHNEKIDAPRGWPARLKVGQLKEMLSMPDIPLADESEAALSFTGGCVEDLSVEPKAGTVVETRGGESVSLSVDEPRAGFMVSRLITKLELAQSKQSVKETVSLAKDEIAKIRLQFLYLPLGFLLLGTACLLVGGFAGVKRVKDGTDEGDAGGENRPAGEL